MANPSKPQPIIDILTNNREKLLKFLEDFLLERGEGVNFTAGGRALMCLPHGQRTAPFLSNPPTHPTNRPTDRPTANQIYQLNPRQTRTSSSRRRRPSS